MFRISLLLNAIKGMKIWRYHINIMILCKADLKQCALWKSPYKQIWLDLTRLRVAGSVCKINVFPRSSQPSKASCSDHISPHPGQQDQLQDYDGSAVSVRQLSDIIRGLSVIISHQHLSVSIEMTTLPVFLLYVDP